MLKIEPVVLSDWLDVWCERNKGVKDDSKVSGLTARRLVLPLTEIRKPGGEVC